MAVDKVVGVFAILTPSVAGDAERRVPVVAATAAKNLGAVAVGFQVGG